MDILNEYIDGDIYAKHNVTVAPQEADFYMHIHDTCEICYIVSGNIEYLVEGTVYSIPPCSLVIMRPYESHKTKIVAPEIYERYVINFPLSMFDGIDPEKRLLRAFLLRESGQNCLYRIKELEGLSIEKLFREVCYCDDDDYGRKLKIHTMLLRILDALDGAYLKRGIAQVPKSREAEMVAYVNMHISEDITIPKLAEHFYLSPSQFSRVFKVVTGASPWSYITLKRLSAAREKIRLGSSMQSAYLASGFNDYSSFYRAYVKFFGNSPVEDAAGGKKGYSCEKSVKKSTNL